MRAQVTRAFASRGRSRGGWWAHCPDCEWVHRTSLYADAVYLAGRHECALPVAHDITLIDPEPMAGLCEECGSSRSWSQNWTGAHWFDPGGGVWAWVCSSCDAMGYTRTEEGTA
jgi:hypothetical protein